MNAGTAGHEQNGVTTPSPDASTFPDAFAAASEQRTGAFDGHEIAEHGDHKEHADQ